jgi:hypothetical protein
LISATANPSLIRFPRHTTRRKIPNQIETSANPLFGFLRRIVFGICIFHISFFRLPEGGKCI